MTLTAEQKNWLKKEYPSEVEEIGEAGLEALFDKHKDDFDKIPTIGGNEEKDNPVNEQTPQSQDDWKDIKVTDDVKKTHLAGYTKASDGDYYVHDGDKNATRFQQKGNNYRLVTEDNDGNPRNPSHEELDALIATTGAKTFRLNNTFDKESLAYLAEQYADRISNIDQVNEWVKANAQQEEITLDGNQQQKEPQTAAKNSETNDGSVLEVNQGQAGKQKENEEKLDSKIYTRDDLNKVGASEAYENWETTAPGDSNSVNDFLDSKAGSQYKAQLSPEQKDKDDNKAEPVEITDEQRKVFTKSIETDLRNVLLVMQGAGNDDKAQQQQKMDIFYEQLTKHGHAAFGENVTADQLKDEAQTAIETWIQKDGNRNSWAINVGLDWDKNHTGILNSMSDDDTFRAYEVKDTKKFWELYDYQGVAPATKTKDKDNEKSVDWVKEHDNKDKTKETPDKEPWRLRSLNSDENASRLDQYRLEVLKDMGIISEEQINQVTQASANMEGDIIKELKSHPLDEKQQAEFDERMAVKVANDNQHVLNSLPPLILAETYSTLQDLVQREASSHSSEGSSDYESQYQEAFNNVAARADDVIKQYGNNNGYFFADVTNAADVYEGYQKLFNVREADAVQDVKEAIAKGRAKNEALITDYDKQLNLANITENDATRLDARFDELSKQASALQLDDETTDLLKNVKFYDADGKEEPQFDTNGKMLPDGKLASMMEIAKSNLVMENLGSDKELTAEDLSNNLTVMLYAAHVNTQIEKGGKELPDQFTNEAYIAEFKDKLTNIGGGNNNTDNQQSIDRLLGTAYANYKSIRGEDLPQEGYHETEEFKQFSEKLISGEILTADGGKYADDLRPYHDDIVKAQSAKTKSNDGNPIEVSNTAYEGTVYNAVNYTQAYAKRLNDILNGDRECKKSDKEKPIKSVADKMSKLVKKFDKRADGRTESQMSLKDLKKRYWKNLAKSSGVTMAVSFGLSKIKGVNAVLGASLAVGMTTTAIVSTCVRYAKDRKEQGKNGVWIKDKDFLKPMVPTALGATAAGLTLGGNPKLGMVAGYLAIAASGGFKANDTYKEFRAAGVSKVSAALHASGELVARFAAGYAGRALAGIGAGHEEGGTREVKDGEAHNYSDNEHRFADTRNDDMRYSEHLKSIWQVNPDEFRENMTNQIDALAKNNIELNTLGSDEQLHSNSDVLSYKITQLIALKPNDEFTQHLVESINKGTLSAEDLLKTENLVHFQEHDGLNMGTVAGNHDAWSYTSDPSKIDAGFEAKDVTHTESLPGKDVFEMGGVMGTFGNCWKKIKNVFKKRPGALSDKAELGEQANIASTEEVSIDGSKPNDKKIAKVIEEKRGLIEKTNSDKINELAEREYRLVRGLQADNKLNLDEFNAYKKLVEKEFKDINDTTITGSNMEVFYNRRMGAFKDVMKQNDINWNKESLKTGIKPEALARQEMWSRKITVDGKPVSLEETTLLHLTECAAVGRNNPEKHEADKNAIDPKKVPSAKSGETEGFEIKPGNELRTKWTKAISQNNDRQLDKIKSLTGR